MATLAISDVVVPAEFTAYQVENSFVSTAFYQSGVAQRNGVIQEQLSLGAESFTVPTWNDNGETEPNYSTDNPADVAQTLKITAHPQVVRKTFANQAWGSADLAAELSGSDPLGRIQSRVSAYWDRQMEKRLIASLQGIMAANVANNNGDMVIDISGAAGAASLFNGTSVINAAGTLGDKLETVKGIAMHSHIYTQALINDEIQFIPTSQGTAIKTYKGLAVLIDDNLVEVVGGVTKYITVLFGVGAVGYGMAEPRQGLGTELFRIPSGGNGGGITQLWTRFNMAIVPVGWSWNDGSGANAVVGDSPSLTDLANPAHWTRVSVSRKACPLAFLISL